MACAKIRTAATALSPGPPDKSALGFVPGAQSVSWVYSTHLGSENWFMVSLAQALLGTSAAEPPPCLVVLGKLLLSFLPGQVGFSLQAPVASGREGPLLAFCPL